MIQPAGLGMALSIACHLRWTTRIDLTFLLFQIVRTNCTKLSWHWNLDFTRVVSESAAIFEYARQGSITDVQRLLAAGKACAKDVTKSGMTLLHTASKPGNEDLVRLLIREGAEIDGPDEDGETPLHRALEFDNNYQVARLLIENGADLANKTTDGRTPLHTLFSSTIAEIILKEHLLEAVLPSTDGTSTTHLLSRSSRTTLDMFQKGRKFDLAELWAQDNLSRTCLHFASSAGNLEILSMLLGQALTHDVERQDSNGRRPLHYAAETSRAAAVIDMLVARGCDLYAVDGRGQTAMHWVASWRQLAAARRLAALDPEGRLMRMRKDGKRPLDLVCKEKEPTLFAVLKSSEPSTEPEATVATRRRLFGLSCNNLGVQVARIRAKTYGGVLLLASLVWLVILLDNL